MGKRMISREQKANYLRISLALAGIATNNQTADLIQLIIEKVKIKKGEFSILDAVDLEENSKKYFSDKSNIDKENEKL